VKQGAFKTKCGFMGNPKRTMFLFSDLLVVCEPTGGKHRCVAQYVLAAMYILLSPRSTNTFAIGKDDSPGKTSEPEFEITMERQEEAHEWITLLQKRCIEHRSKPPATIPAADAGAAGAAVEQPWSPHKPKGVLKLEEYMGTHHRVVRGSLHSSCLFGRVDFAQQMIKDGADVNVADRVGACPLHLCALGGHEPTTKLVLDHGAAMSLADRDKHYGMSPLHVAVLCGHTHLIHLLAGYAPPQIYGFY